LVYFGLAYIYLITGREKAGIKYARHSLDLLEPTNAIQLYLDQGERCRIICNALVENDQKSAFVYSVLEHLPKVEQTPTAKIETIEEIDLITVECLGQLKVLRNGQEITKEQWVSSKARDLLAYFVTFRGERISIDRVFDEVWADTDAQSKTAFHTALSRLRGALRSNNKSTKFILVESGQYWLDVPRFKVDVDEFDNLIKKGQAATSEEISMRWYQQAIEIYQGEYLQNFYFDWVFPERRRLSKCFIETLNALAEQCFTRSEYEKAITFWEKAIWEDPVREDIHCQLMVTKAEMGDRSGVIRQYKQLEEMLQEQLEVVPSQTSIDLYKSLIK
jgi:two-component SAPR family response regulator